MEEYKPVQDVTHRLQHCHSAALFLLLLALAPAVFASHQVELVLSSDQKYYQQTASQIKVSVQQQHPETTFISRLVDKPGWPANNSALVVAVGSKACGEALVKITHTPLLCTFLPRSNYSSLVAKLPASPLRTNPPTTVQHAAIYFDQPMSRYMALIKLVTPKALQLGTAVGPQSSQLLPEIEKLASEQPFGLHHTQLHDGKSPLSALTTVVEQSDVFLVNPDKAKLNKSVAKWLLRLCIRQRIPVIAYSSNYVNAGALAAIYSSPENIGRDTGDTINRWLGDTSKALEESHYPRYFTVSSNPHVARALSIKLPGDEQLQADIEQILNSPTSSLSNE